MVQELIGSYPRPDSPPKNPEEFWLVARSVLRHGVHWFHEHPVQCKVVLRLQPNPPTSAAEVYKKIPMLVVQLFLNILAVAQEIGAARTDLPFPFLMELVMGARRTCDKWLIMHVDEPEEVLEEKISIVIDVFQRLVEPR